VESGELVDDFFSEKWYHIVPVPRFSEVCGISSVRHMPSLFHTAVESTVIFAPCVDPVSAGFL
jgi:hypothetical protein